MRPRPAVLFTATYWAGLATGLLRFGSPAGVTSVSLGLALLMMINGYIAGTMEDVLQNSIRLRTGHVQIRNFAG